MNKKLLLRMMPMREADGGAAGTPDGGANGGSEPPKPMTMDEFLKLEGNQAEFDRRMSKGIETALTKERARFETVLNERLDEQERLSKMTDGEKAAYLQNKQQSELNRREVELTRRELKADAKQTLINKGMSADFADFLNYTDKDAVESSIAKLETVFNAAVQMAVNEKLKGGKPPKDASTEGNGSQTEADKIREQFAKGLNYGKLF